MSLLSNGDEKPTNGTGEDGDHDPHYEPIIYLPEVHIHSNEEEETILVNLYAYGTARRATYTIFKEIGVGHLMVDNYLDLLSPEWAYHPTERAKLFRHDNNEKVWKERGTGEVKLLFNEDLNTVRVVMRRDKTLKLCANHYVTTDMELKSNCGSDRAWVWSTQADVSDGDPQAEVLAIRFQNADAAKKWKDKFEEAKSIVAQGVKTNDSEKEEDKDSAVSDDSEIENSDDSEVVRQVEKLSLATSKTETKDETQPVEEKKDDPNDESQKAED